MYNIKKLITQQNDPLVERRYPCVSYTGPQFKEIKNLDSSYEKGSL